MFASNTKKVRHYNMALLALGVAVVSLLALAIWSGLAVPANEALRVGKIQIRFLHRAKDGLQNCLEDVETKLQRLASLGAVVAGNPLDQTEIEQFREVQTLPFDSIHLRRYGSQGELLWEYETGGRRFPDLKAQETRTLVKWMRQMDDPSDVRLDLFSDRASHQRNWIRFTARVWSLETGSRGFVCLWLDTNPILVDYLGRTLPLEHSYSFVLASETTVKEPNAEPVLFWLAGDHLWHDLNSPDASDLIKAVHSRTSIINDSGEHLEIVSLPRPNGEQRKEVLAAIPMRFGAERWFLCLSTPYDVAAKFSIEQRFFLIAVTLLALGIPLIAVKLLHDQNVRHADEAHEQRQKLFAENPTAIFMLDDQGCVIDCNYSAERLLGTSRQEVIRKPLSDFFESRTIGLLWWSLREHGNLHTRDATLVRVTDRNTLVVEIWGRHIGNQWILMAHDVERRRDMQQQVARRKRLDLVGELASTLAHDFNNLLGQIQILVSNLRTELPAESPIQDDLATVETKVDDACELASNLLAVRDTVAAREPVALGSLLNEYVADHRKVIPERVALHYESARELPKVWVTPHALRRILDNLCSNAVDAMPYGGDLTIRASARSLTDSESNSHDPLGDYAILEIADTGTGMSDEVLDNLFRPFFTTKREGQGTGLGLWTVYRIVQRVGGRIEARSKLGKGTLFTIFLPLQLAGLEPDGDANALEAESSGSRDEDGAYPPPLLE